MAEGVLLMPLRFGPFEIALVLIIILIVFGVGKLPQVGGAIGNTIREFRKASRGDNDREETAAPDKAVADNSRT